MPLQKLKLRCIREAGPEKYTRLTVRYLQVVSLYLRPLCYQPYRRPQVGIICMGRYSSHSRRAKHGFQLDFRARQKNIAQCQDVNMNLGGTRNVPNYEIQRMLQSKAGKLEQRFLFVSNQWRSADRGLNCSEQGRPTPDNF